MISPAVTPALTLSLAHKKIMKLAPEGYPFILGFGALTVLVSFFSPWAGAVPLIMTLFMLYFFRDPDRNIPEGDNVFVSPADGKVLVITNNPPVPPVLEEGEGDASCGEGGFVEISIFMSPLDVHVNRAPCDGIVKSVVHTPGKFIAAFKDEASLQNENIALLLDTKFGKVLSRQVAGSIARRAVCRLKPGDTVKKGERYGIIKFSSRLDLYLPKKTKIRVKPGDLVKAGETIVGEI